MNALAFLITGDKPDTEEQRISPHRSTRQLEEFFRDFVPEHVPPGSSSRLNYTREMLRHHRTAGNLRAIVEAALDPLHFRRPDQPSLDAAIAFVRVFLERDGFQLRFDGGRCRVDRQGVVADVASLGDDDDYSRAIGDYVAESERRLSDGDHDGVITLARTMVEAALMRVEALLENEPPKYDGDLPALYKRVSRRLNIGTDRMDIHESLKLVLRGLNSIVAGLAPYRNTASDAHATTYRAPEHHARLAMNAARTVVDFLNATLRFQYDRDRFKGPKA